MKKIDGGELSTTCARLYPAHGKHLLTKFSPQMKFLS